ncbi:hypothetical protein [Geobacter sp.]|uniref:hypothetical protein n=1 Tax=Geobacter sp. TaxID=46610 RepID=UPI00260D28DF|nr:hypothetical protein [Geobacter sp.]
MKYALIVIQKPESMNPTEANAWSNFSENLTEKLKTYEFAKTLSETTLQISLEKSLRSFLEIQKLCKVAGYPTMTSFFLEEPNWLTS